MDAEEITQALEYVSRDLRRKNLHVHLIVGGCSLPCLLYKTKPTCTSLSILLVSELTPKTMTTLTRSVQRAQKLFNLNTNWVNTTLGRSVPEDLREIVVERSLLQNDIFFSSEGLTLFALDHCYALKSTLDKLSRGSWDASFDDAVDILRRLVYISRGKPMTRGYIRRCYPSMEVTDNMLLRLKAEYERQHGHRGMVGVNDEYIRWNRDGLKWSEEIEEYGRELGISISRSTSAASSRSDWEDKPLPDPPSEEEDIAAIFAKKGGFI
ncbi:hypothetical protein FN846DRAFT_897565 [Sphaerosporella brunnea]|uniref:DUF7582 domain-containing protein n=1 Tax=Sphaerosporella brunnea TaxID=1250544 RepID=A0A5J5F5H1_9PEZI|nr:hypothetical protein FN846DRAFT_897565 [Sphaerosporella brunnea]